MSNKTKYYALTAATPLSVFGPVGTTINIGIYAIAFVAYFCYL